MKIPCTANSVSFAWIHTENKWSDSKLNMGQWKKNSKYNWQTNNLQSNEKINRKKKKRRKKNTEKDMEREKKTRADRVKCFSYRNGKAVSLWLLIAIEAKQFDCGFCFNYLMTIMRHSFFGLIFHYTEIKNGIQW